MRNADPLPPDISSHGLEIPRETPSDKPTVILDFDHFSDNSMDYSTEEVVACIRRLHDTTSKAFWATITEHAINKWL